MAVSLIGMLLLGVQYLQGQLPIEEAQALGLSMIATELLSPALTLPFVFRFGVEKGRMAYYLVIGGGGAAVMLFMGGSLQPSLPVALLCMAP